VNRERKGKRNEGLAEEKRCRVGRLRGTVRDRWQKHRDSNQNERQKVTTQIVEGFSSYPYKFSPSERAINAAIDRIVAAFDKYIITPLLGVGPVGAAGDD